MSDFRVPPRHDIIQKFSTFLCRVEDSQGRSRYAWVSEPPLARNIRRCQKQELLFGQSCQSGNETYLVQYFLEIWKNDSYPESERQLARQHLAAYLESPRYGAARDRFSAFKDFDAPDETWDCYLHIAGCLTNNPDKIGALYKKYKQTASNLEKHFQLELASLIRDIYYQETGQGKYSPWYSLKKVSDRKLKQGLHNLEKSDAQITCYLQAKECLFEVYSKSARGWIEPTPQQYQAAADYYNRHYLQPPAASPIKGETVETWMRTCLKALQSSPKIYHLDNYNEASFPKNLSKKLMSGDPLATLESQHFSEKLERYRDELKAVLVKKLEEFEGQGKNRVFLLLRYGLGLSQTRIAAEIGVHQSQISHRCDRFERDMLRYTVEWVKKHLDISLGETKNIEIYMSAWIKQHYQFYIHSVLMAGFQRLDAPSQRMLQLAYGQEIEEEEIAEKCQMTKTEVTNTLKKIIEPLQEEIVKWYRENLNIGLEKDKKKIQGAIEDWLKQVSYAHIN